MSLKIAVSGLVAFQRALNTTSHNIANVATEGYSRQRVELSARTPQLFGPNYIGKGTQTSDIVRVYDQFKTDLVRDRTSNVKELEAFQGVANQLDAVFGDEEAGLNPALNEFFNSLQDLSTSPASTPARQVVLSKAESLSERFHTLNSQLSDMQSSVNKELEINITQVNGLSQSIADINHDIVLAKGAASGGNPNDLLDQRDVLIQQLAEYVDVSTVPADDGSVNVFIGNGQPLVLGATAQQLVATRNEFDVSQTEVSLQTNGNTLPITKYITGGELGGLLRVREEVINTAQQQLGKISIGLSSAFNTQHTAGSDLLGAAGNDFFNTVDTSAPTVLPSSNNNPASGSVSMTIDSVNALQASDYQLNYDGASFSLIRLRDNTVVDSGFTVGDMPRTVGSEGISLSLSGSVSAGDGFLVRPTYNAAGQFGVQIKDTNEIAAGAAGSLQGNNENALALTQIQTSKILKNGTATIQESFGEIIADVGVKTNAAFVKGRAQQALLDQAIEAQASVAGVNLDEEAANLIKFQQAYAANATVVRVMDEVFQTLLNAAN